MPIPVTKCQDVLIRWEKSHVLEIAEGHDKVALLGFLASSADKESTCNARDIGDEGLILGWEDLLREEMATHFRILA